MNSGQAKDSSVISGYALETRCLRNVGLSFAHDTLVLCFPWLFVLWLLPRCIVSLTLDPELPVMYTHTCTHHTLVFNFALDIQRLCILGSGIPHKSNLLVFGFALDTRTRGVIYGGWGSSPPSNKQKKEKKEKKERKKEKRERKEKKREKKEKKGTMNSVKLLHIKCCFFQLVRWHWKI